MKTRIWNDTLGYGYIIKEDEKNYYVKFDSDPWGTHVIKKGGN